MTQRTLLLITAFLIGMSVISVNVLAQNFQGIATYRSDRNMSNFGFEGDNMSPDMVENLKAQLKKQFQKEFELKFNLTESTWQEAESLDSGPATATSGGMVLSISMDNGTVYKNTEKLLLIQQTESFSKLFLISDKLENRNWVLTGESKKIGDYKVEKATYQKIAERKTVSFENGENKMETVLDTTSITVWFAPEIPVPHGPDDMWGLPGLVLEMSDGNITYLCTKIVLNPKDGVDIKKPSKGNKVTREEFKKISDAAAEKMMKQYSGKGDGQQTMTIKINN